ncbi:hypothetical protein HYH02_006387 [Chlamydomonas schloesseri]|uniref:Cationic amino acid transporter C-terminal domain-containing protein n=1 Tax=Chlamydomonas schloesseri TaxID=2026947 RepID=A0A835WJD0_9CHLO|nr:hypothetical protein HYH02_006387 [Chlamydomonas schloesseri]|eukprot:KAG2448496.1 hypothetical protein HYH02_006387 [Chlamydomonas schloesseri]
MASPGRIERAKSKLKSTYAKFRAKAFVVRSMEEQKDKTASGFEMHKVLGAFSLVMLGIGCIIGAGVFVLTGVAARKYAGPGVVVSYGLSAVTAMLTAFCYAEYAAELPVAGGAFNYVSMTFGEFAAWVTACDLVLEYTLSAAAVAKGFTAYTAALIGIDVSYLRLQASVFTLDLPALASVVGMSFILMRSTADSSAFNNLVTGLNVALIIFVLAAGFPHVEADNYHPFAPFGARGIFTGASVVFFSFIGFDTVATAAEEVKNPGRDLPIGIVGSLAICTCLYVLMCLVITGMQNYTVIDLNAPFAVAFDHVGLGWAQRIVAAGALTGIITSLLGSLLGQARIYVTLGRQNLAPAWLAKVHPTRGTPVNATFVTMFTAGFLALFIEIELLAELVSIGTLVVFCSVCAGVLFRRYHVHGSGEPLRPVLGRLGGVVLAAICFSVSFTEAAPAWVPSLFLAAWFAVTLSFYKLPVRYTPQVFRCPLSPWLPSAGMLATLHLIGSLGWPAYVRWIVWFSLGTTVYLTYGMHRSQVGAAVAGPATLLLGCAPAGVGVDGMGVGAGGGGGGWQAGAVAAGPRRAREAMGAGVGAGASGRRGGEGVVWGGAGFGFDSDLRRRGVEWSGHGSAAGATGAEFSVGVGGGVTLRPIAEAGGVSVSESIRSQLEAAGVAVGPGVVLGAGGGYAGAGGDSSSREGSGRAGAHRRAAARRGARVPSGSGGLTSGGGAEGGGGDGGDGGGGADGSGGELDVTRTRSDGGEGTPLEQHLIRHGPSGANGSPAADDDSVHSGTALTRPSTDVAHSFAGPSHHRANSHAPAAGGGHGAGVDAQGLGVAASGLGGGGAQYGFVYGRPYGAAPLPEVELGGVGAQPGAGAGGGGGARAGGVGDSVGLLGAVTARSDAPVPGWGGR